MKVIIVVYEGDEWKRDTLEARMVDTRIKQMVAEFTRNHVPVEVIRQEEVKEWKDDVVEFARDVLGIKLLPHQEEFLRGVKAS